MQQSITRRVLVGVAGWTVTLALCFPIFWMVVSSFKTEIQAIDSRSLFWFHPDLSAYWDVITRSHYWWFASNSLIESVGATLVALVLAIPAAYAMAFRPSRRTRGTLLWMLSTKMMPSVGGLIPIYLIYRSTGLLDTCTGLVIINAVMNLPIVVWMLFTFFKEIPGEIMESGRMDGANLWHELGYLLVPLALPGIAATAFLSIILCWNEAFWSLNLTAAQSAPLTQFITSFASPKALFLSKLSAASTMAVVPVLILGWISLGQLMRGLGGTR